VPKLAVGPTHPVDCLMGVKWPGHEVDHSSPSSAKVKIEWSCTSTCHMPSRNAQGQLCIYLFVFHTSLLRNLDSIPFWYLNIFLSCVAYFIENISLSKVYVCLPVSRDLFLLDHHVSCDC
jgi:hypothetical protein